MGEDSRDQTAESCGGVDPVLLPARAISWGKEVQSRQRRGSSGGGAGVMVERVL